MKQQFISKANCYYSYSFQVMTKKKKKEVSLSLRPRIDFYRYPVENIIEDFYKKCKYINQNLK